MASLSAFLVLNGLMIVFISSVGGLALYGVLIRDGDPHDWHLLHAGGSARGIFLIALGGTVHLAVLSPTHAWAAAGLVVFFVWASTLAMLLRALSGESGFSFSGAMLNRVGFVLYVMGAISLAVGLVWLCWGFAGVF